MEYLPVAVKDILLNSLETRNVCPNRLGNEEMEVCIAKWRGLPTAYHHDQLNLGEFGHTLLENTWRSCLMVGGLLTIEEACAIQSLIVASAMQGGETILAHDWESAYILNWRDHQHSHHKAILNTVLDAPCSVELPFPATSHWRDAKCNWSILQDKKVDTTGALERWCTAKWGSGNVGVWKELQCDTL